MSAEENQSQSSNSQPQIDLRELVSSILENLPEQYHGTIIEDAIHYILRLRSKEQLYQIMQEFRRRYPRVRRLTNEQARQAFRWLAERICEVYSVPTPRRIDIIERVEYWRGQRGPVPMTDLLRGSIQTTKSIISFLHELRHHIARHANYSQSEYLVQKWAIALWAMAYHDKILEGRVRIVDNFWVTLIPRTRIRAQRMYQQIEERLIQSLNQQLSFDIRNTQFYQQIRELIINAIEEYLRNQRRRRQ